MRERKVFVEIPEGVTELIVEHPSGYIERIHVDRERDDCDDDEAEPHEDKIGESKADRPGANEQQPRRRTRPGE